MNRRTKQSQLPYFNNSFWNYHFLHLNTQVLSNPRIFIMQETHHTLLSSETCLAPYHAATLISVKYVLWGSKQRKWMLERRDACFHMQRHWKLQLSFPCALGGYVKVDRASLCHCHSSSYYASILHTFTPHQAFH